MRGISVILVISIMLTGVCFADTPGSSVVQANMLVVGDIMSHQQQINSAAISIKDNIYDFKPVYEKVKPFIEQADFAMGNLEMTLSGKDKQYAGYPCFNTPDQLAEALKYAGFDAVTTINNHSLDRGIYGLNRTIDVLDRVGLKHTGTFKDKESAGNLYIQEINGIKVAILAYTFSTNGIVVPKGKEFSVKYINKELMKSEIKKAKDLGADIVTVSLHMGTEYVRTQNKQQEEMVDFLFSNGVDIVFGNHPHVVQPMKFKTVEYNGVKKDCFVIYSLGNFVSGMSSRYKNTGVMLNVKLEKDIETGKTVISAVEYIPTWVDNRAKYSIVPLKSTIEQIVKQPAVNKAYLDNLRARLLDITSLIGDKDSRIIVK